MADETPGNYSLNVDRGDQAIGASLGGDNRRRLHTYIANQNSEPIPINIVGGNLGSQILTGVGVPATTLGNNSDFYLDTATGNYYQKANGLWGSALGNLTGPTGATGATGPTGLAGSVWYTGSGVPSNGLGVQHDMYLNTANGDVYTKGSSTWGSPIENITGPAGTSGITQLTGDVLAGPGSGTQTALIASVGGSTAALVHSGELLANGATNANTALKIVQRDSSGNFSAGVITANLSGNATTATSATSFTGPLTGDVTGTQSATVIAANAVTNAKAAQMVNNTIKSNVSGGTANPADNTFATLANTAVTISSNANAKGVANTFALSDHTHQHTTGTAVLGSVPQYDGSNWQAVNPVNLSLPSFGYTLFDDFYAFNSGGLGPGSLLWNTYNVGGSQGGVGTFATEVNHPGLFTSTTGTTTTGIGSVYLGPSASPGGPILLGGGQVTLEWDVKTSTLGTVAQQYFIKAGFVDTVSQTITVPNNGVYFQYANGVNGDFWTTQVSSAGTTTTNVTTSAVTANTWYRLTIVINPAASSVTFYVNGTSVATTVTNIPTSVSIVPTVLICKTAGTAARTMIVDYFMLNQIFTTPR